MFHSAVSRPLLRTATVNATTTTPAITRAFSGASVTMAEGDTGAPKDTGSWTQKDSFARREAAQETLYIRNQEMDKLKALQEKLNDQHKHVQNLDKQIENINKGHGDGNK